jgi:hypothetical protein
LALLCLYFLCLICLGISPLCPMSIQQREGTHAELGVISNLTTYKLYVHESWWNFNGPKFYLEL